MCLQGKQSISKKRCHKFVANTPLKFALFIHSSFDMPTFRFFCWSVDHKNVSSIWIQKIITSKSTTDFVANMEMAVFVAQCVAYLTCVIFLKLHNLHKICAIFIFRTESNISLINSNCNTEIRFWWRKQHFIQLQIGIQILTIVLNYILSQCLPEDNTTLYLSLNKIVIVSWPLIC